jgi:hypothetical protein
MHIWTFSVLVVLVALLFVDWRRRYPRSSKSLNVWFGPLPAHGQNQIVYLFKDGLYALAWFIVLVLPLTFLSPSDGRGGFGSDQSATSLVVWALLLGLSAMAFVALAACLAKAFLLMLFARSQVFDQSLGRFVRRAELTTSHEA